MRRLLLLLCTLALPASALAEGEAPLVTRFSSSDTGIANVALSTSPSFTLTVTNLTTLVVYATLTRAAATDLGMQCYVGPSAQVQRPIAMQNPNFTAGLVPLAAAKLIWQGLTASGTYGFYLQSLADDVLTCTFTGTGATSSDKLTVVARGQLP
jgi:hypothetical protein